MTRPRRQLINLLRESQTATESRERWSTALTVDPGAQLREVASLVEQGLVSASEFDAQRRKVSDS